MKKGKETKKDKGDIKLGKRKKREEDDVKDFFLNEEIEVVP